MGRAFQLDGFTGKILTTLPSISGFLLAMACFKTPSFLKVIKQKPLGL